MHKEILDVTERSRNVYFDTSIYNRLLDDPEKERLLKIIREKNLIIIPSVINLCELLITSTPERKKELISIYNEIRNDFHPLKPSPWLLKDSVESVEKGDNEWEITYPISINKKMERICHDLASQGGKEIEPYLQGARNYIQEIAKKKRLSDELQYFSYIDSETGQIILLKLFAQICESVEIVFHFNEDTQFSIIKSPFLPWKYYLESYAYLFYRRAFPDKKYGKKSNPGPSDLEQCVYLFWTGKFVIEDANFLIFLKRLKAIRDYQVNIINYSEFKHYLL